MWRPRVGAHDGPMFRTHTEDMTRALVAEHQATLRHEARQHQVGRRTRRRPRRINSIVKLWLADLSSPLAPIPSVREYQLR